MKENFDKTQQLPMDNFVKSIPVVCSCCNKIYQIKKYLAEDGVEAGASYGVCPQCEEEQRGDSPSSEETDDESEETTFNKTISLNIDEMLKSIPVVCAWCNKIYHIQAWEVEEGKKTGVSHGICAECEKREQDKLAALKKDS